MSVSAREPSPTAEMTGRLHLCSVTPEATNNQEETLGFLKANECPEQVLNSSHVLSRHLMSLPEPKEEGRG